MSSAPNTSDRIRQAAAALFRERGFNGTSMQELARAVGITKSSLYHHFSSKQALLSEIIELTVNRVTPAVEAVAAANLPAAERLRQVVVLHTIEAIRGRDDVACFTEEGRYLAPDYMAAHVAKRDRYELSFRRILEDGIRTGEFRHHDVPVTAMAILGMCNWVVRWYRPEGERSPDEIAERFADLAVRGVRTDQPPGKGGT